jgi:hypothetical protein
VLPPALTLVPILVLSSANNALADSAGFADPYLALLSFSPAPKIRWQILLVVLTLLSPSLSFSPALTMHWQILLVVLTLPKQQA